MAGVINPIAAVSNRTTGRVGEVSCVLEVEAMEFWDNVAMLVGIAIFLMPTFLVAWEVGWGHRNRRPSQFRVTLRTVFCWITVTCLCLSVWRFEWLLLVSLLIISAFTVALLTRFVIEDIFAKRNSARDHSHKQITVFGGVEVGDSRSTVGTGHTQAGARSTRKDKTTKWWLKRSSAMRLGRYGIWN